MRKLILLALLVCSALPVFAGVNYKVGSFQSGVGIPTATVAVTGVGFAPKVIILKTSFQPSLTAGNNSSMSVGFATSQNASTIDSQRAAWAGCIIVDPSVCKSRRETSLVLIIYTGTVTHVISGSFSATSMDSDGFTLTVGTTFLADTTILYEAWGGTDYTSVGIATVTKTGTGNVSDTSLGFLPSFLFVMATNATANATTTAGANLDIGFTDGTNAALQSSFCSDGTATSACGTYTRAAASQLEILAALNTATAVSDRYSLVTLDTNGFTLNHVEATTVQLIDVLAIKGGQWHVGPYTAATTATTFDVTDGAFTPIGVGVTNARATAQSTSDTAVANAACGLGASDGTTSGAAAAAGRDARTANEGYWNLQSTARMQLRLLTTAATVDMDFNFTAFLSNGWRGTVVTADASHIFGAYYSFAANASTHMRHSVK